jgi:hypothetical protein
MRQSCVEAQKAPSLEDGALRDEGFYYRNVKGKHMPRRYPEDKKDPPVYGYRLKPDHWKDASKRNDGFSINCADCCSPRCSILLSNLPPDFRAVLRFSLDALSRCVNQTLVAQYAPFEDNGCHFDLLSLESTKTAYLLLKDCFESSQFPTEYPKESDSEAKALQSLERQSIVFLMLPDASEQALPIVSDTATPSRMEG